MSLDQLMFLFISLVVVGLGTFLFYKASGTLSLTKLNPISLVYYFLMVFSVIGTVLIVLNVDRHHMARYVRHGNVRTTAWLLVMGLMVTFPGVVLLLNKVFKYDPVKEGNYLQKPVTSRVSSRSAFITLSIATAVCVAAVIYTFIITGIDRIPVVALLRGADEKTMAFLRNDVGVNFAGNQYLRNIFAIGLTPLISYIAYVYARKEKGIKWWALLVVLFVSSCAILFYDLQKAPILIYLATFFIVTIFYGDRMKWWYYAILGAVAVAGIVVMYAVIAGSSLDKIFSMEGPINRIVLTSAMALVLHLEVFTYRTGLLAGASLPGFIVRRFFGLPESVRSGRIVMETVNKIGIKSGTAGVYNSLFLGEAYANFGNWGILLSMLHLPLLFFLLRFVFTRLKKTPMTVALYAYLTMEMLMGLHGGYTDYVINVMWIVVILVVVAMSLFETGLDRFFPGGRNDREKSESAPQSDGEDKRIVDRIVP